MKYCAECKISISSGADCCPLCRGELPDSGQPDAAEEYPGFEPMMAKEKKLSRIASAAAGALIAAFVLSNLLIWNGHIWCVVASAIVLYVWGLGLLSIQRRVHLGWKLIAHAVAIPCLLIIANAFASRAEMISRVTWAISYAMPAVFVCFIIVINFIMFHWRQKRHDYLLYQLALCIIAFAPLILVLSGVARPVYPSIVAAGCSVATIGWLLIFAKKVVRTEFERKFHI